MARTEGPADAFADVDEADLREAFEAQDYVAEDDIVTTVLLALRLGKPLLVEGEPGSGKTELGKVLAAGFDTELIRLQCYEGLTAENTLYEWNYTKQLLAVQAGERGVSADASVFEEDYLLERPLLRALTAGGDRPPVLLIDEIDRADEEFEALLLEVLSEFQVSVPELGTLRAERPPVVVITSNRTRGLSDALKRRCLYLHIEPPSFEKERTIVREKVPE
ncbi:MAG: MoxR family ATPase, partial [Halobacteriales archaeon]|nr:MoxR family ATPase [Halobacteriales archaeon]